MQCREHEVTSESGFDGDLRGFKIADFTNQNDVRILTQERTKSRGEVQSDLFLHLHLVYARQIELDWIFGGHDVRIDGVQ